MSKALGARLSKHGIERARPSRISLKLVCWVAILLALLGVYITAYLLIQNVIKTVELTLVLVLPSALLRPWRLDREQRVSASRSTQDAAKARLADEHVSQVELLRANVGLDRGGVSELVGGAAGTVCTE